ncbi:hypothetical protein ACWGDT_00200 [Streptomyces avermitilis]
MARREPAGHRAQRVPKVSCGAVPATNGGQAPRQTNIGGGRGPVEAAACRQRQPGADQQAVLARVEVYGQLPEGAGFSDALNRAA